MTVFCVYGRSLKDVKTFSWLQEEMSISIVNEIVNCLLRHQEKTMLHLTPIRCYIFRRKLVDLKIAERNMKRERG